MKRNWHSPLQKFLDESVSDSDAQILSNACSDRHKANIKIGPAIRLALNDEAYRNAETAPGTNQWFTYKEIDLIGLFQAFLEASATETETDGNSNGNGGSNGINGEEKEALLSSFRLKGHRLKIATTSLPDLSFLRRLNGVVEFVLGEVKHASKCTWEHAKQQIARYLQALLYFLRVKSDCQSPWCADLPYVGPSAVESEARGLRPNMPLAL